MNTIDSFAPTNRTKNQHSWLLALLISAGVHALIIFGAMSFWPSPSSKGQGQTMLLEAIHEQTQIHNAAASSKASKAANASLAEESPSAHGRKPKPNQTSSGPNQTQNIQANASSSNQGALMDQSGQSATPEDSYNQQIFKHLLNKMDSAPVSGQANISLTLIPAGVAINIQITVKEGGDIYGSWLQTKVLNANPFPPIPKSLGGGHFTTVIPIAHQTEPSP